MKVDVDEEVCRVDFSDGDPDAESVTIDIDDIDAMRAAFLEGAGGDRKRASQLIREFVIQLIRGSASKLSEVDLVTYAAMLGCSTSELARMCEPGGAA